MIIQSIEPVQSASRVKLLSFTHANFNHPINVRIRYAKISLKLKAKCDHKLFLTQLPLRYVKKIMDNIYLKFQNQKSVHNRDITF